MVAARSSAFNEHMTTPAAVPILLYHSVSARAETGYRRYNVDPGAFRSQLDLIGSEDRTPIELARLVAANKANDVSLLPLKPIALTFDDGFVDFHESVLPDLAGRKIPAALFIVAGRIGGRSDWSHDVDERGRRLMTAAMIREAADHGVEIGAHGLTHNALDELSRLEVRREIEEPKHILEDLLGHPVRSFAYPHGYHGRWVADAVASAGYECAVGVKEAFSHLHDDRFGLARLTIAGDTPPARVRSWVRGEGASLGSDRERPITTIWRHVRRTRAALRSCRPTTK